MSEKKSYAESVAEKIIEQLEQGTAPWIKPWEPGEYQKPFNPTTGKPYRGFNSIYLSMQGQDDPRWMTYKQANENGWQVKKGAKSTLVQYWSFSEQRPAKDENDKPILDDNGKQKMITVKLERPKVFNACVFNANQIDGIPAFVKPELTWSASDRAEGILSASGADIRHDGGDRAFYRPSTDSIHLPDRAQFPTADNYYATALHELGHWTGHPSRLDRDLANPFGSEAYAKEELRAEISSFMFNTELGLGHDPGQHASYVGSWIKVLKNDPTEIFRAAKDAENIKDYVLGLELQHEHNKTQALSDPLQVAVLDELERVHTQSEAGYSPLESWINIADSAEKLGLKPELKFNTDSSEYAPPFVITYSKDGKPTGITTELYNDGKAATSVAGSRVPFTGLTSDHTWQTDALNSAVILEQQREQTPQKRPPAYVALVSSMQAAKAAETPENVQNYTALSQHYLGCDLPLDTVSTEVRGVIVNNDGQVRPAGENETPTEYGIYANLPDGTQQHLQDYPTRERAEIKNNALNSVIERGSIQGGIVNSTPEDEARDLIDTLKHYYSGKDLAVALNNEANKLQNYPSNFLNLIGEELETEAALIAYTLAQDEREQNPFDSETHPMLHRQFFKGADSLAMVKEIEQAAGVDQTKIYLDVPYAEKEQAKTAGAKWDRGAKAWYVQGNYNEDAITKWLPKVAESTQELDKTDEDYNQKALEYLSYHHGLSALDDDHKAMLSVAASNGDAPVVGAMTVAQEFELPLTRKGQLFALVQNLTHHSDTVARDPDLAFIHQGVNQRTGMNEYIINTEQSNNKHLVGIDFKTNTADYLKTINKSTGEELEQSNQTLLEDDLKNLPRLSQMNARIDNVLSRPVIQDNQPDSKRFYIAVPYSERNEAKALGAKWDGDAKSWYAPDSEKEKFARWHPQAVERQDIKLTPQEEFKTELIKAGFIFGAGELPNMDGKRYRVAVEGDKGTEKSGSYKAYLDGVPAGSYENFKTTVKAKWKSTGSSLSEDEKKALIADAENKKIEREAAEAKRHAHNAKRSNQVYSLMEPAKPLNAYLSDKGVGAHEVKEDKKGRLVIPLRDESGEITSIQRVSQGGFKSLKKNAKKSGSFHMLNPEKFKDGDPIAIGEGYSTVASVVDNVSVAGVMAVDSGNLPAVAQAMRNLYPNSPILIVGDDDVDKSINKGREKAIEAAALVGGLATFPSFGHRAEKETDFNDLQRTHGADAVKVQIGASLNRLIHQHQQAQNQEQQQAITREPAKAKGMSR